MPNKMKGAILIIFLTALATTAPTSRICPSKAVAKATTTECHKMEGYKCTQRNSKGTCTYCVPDEDFLGKKCKNSANCPKDAFECQDGVCDYKKDLFCGRTIFPRIECAEGYMCKRNPVPSSGPVPGGGGGLCITDEEA
ncbi:hypothetical protein TWF703_005078 [Orbilia oligospora]|uniref:TNFR-Cys domain-containing protein n=2 Tax=Orbilia oligospora TaxID=2813651 RepID=A0A7C8NFI6_ORBOL|nr:hypothetical protein TWF703_005078 [Orbilia oligospora]